MIKTEIYLHIGLHKTGTSFLQKMIFPKIKDISFYYPKINEIKDIKPKNKTLISNESIAGQPYLLNKTNRYEMLNYIKKIFPNANIIFVKRNHKDWINSLYKQYIRSGGVYSFQRWFNSIFDLDYIYNKYENELKKKFKNVLILNYEELKEKPDLFIKKLCNFMSVDLPVYEIKNIYSSYTNYQVIICRFFNRIGFKRKLNPIWYIGRH